jgi:hypothetical protein
MQEFIARFVNEINQIASDRHRQELIQKCYSQANSPLNERKETSEINEKTIKTPELHNKYNKFEVENSLNEQVMIRRQGAKDVAALLEAIKAQKAEQRRIYLAESRDIEKKLATIDRRLNTAQYNSNSRLQQRVIAAAQSVKPSEVAHEKISLDLKKQEYDREVQYMMKAEKIKNCKLIKEKLLKESVTRKGEEYTRKKQTQLTNYKKLQEEITTPKARKVEPEYKFFQVS